MKTAENEQEIAVFRLAMILYSIISTSLAGTGIIAALVSGYVTLIPILIAAAVGALLAIPCAYLLARKLYGDPVTG